MDVRRTLVLLAVLSALTGALPASAAADAPATPIATNYVARVSRIPRGLQAKVVDGYLQLWLRVPATMTVYVLDGLGAPWVRFDPAGVSVNRNSQLYYLSQTPVPANVPAGLTATTPPRWVTVSGGHSYMWRDGRLHDLITVALTPGTSYVGHWYVPLRIDGQPAQIGGGVFHADAPSIVWFWPIVVVIACVLAGWRLRRPSLDARLARTLALALLALLALFAVARQLHGRPTVDAGQLVLLAVSLAAVAAAAARLLRGRPSNPLLLLISFASLWAGLDLVPVILHGYVLLAVPAFIARSDSVLLLGGGASLILVALRVMDQSRRAVRA